MTIEDDIRLREQVSTLAVLGQDAFAANAGITRKPTFEAENLSMAMLLVASTGGVTLLPLYAENLLSLSVVTRVLLARRWNLRGQKSPGTGGRGMCRGEDRDANAGR